MTIIIDKRLCLGGSTCGQCKWYDKDLPDQAHGKGFDVETDDELLLQCPKLAIMRCDDETR